ncbi:DUF2267 domain-containing protein [Streptomyces sp. TRM64462]|uniref:DUF2267 domain-containing protein n=1 Tax=Streptomyces sp. TRM64462 TaxID=2741726 RepID=UPI0015868260|nr:DUF2267 domain-containing protein [Streptomyces sp. TRM64462]
MITHERLAEAVASQARLKSTDEALRAVRVTVAAVAHRLDMPRRRRLREALPGPEQDAAYAIVPPAGDAYAELLPEIARNLSTTPERAGLLARTVLSELAEEDQELGRELRTWLPAEYGELLRKS